jgi:hypothetical protein
MTDTKSPRGVHLLGSIPLASAEEVFRSACGLLGDRLRRVPDGETGERLGWVRWQRSIFARHPDMVEAPPGHRPGPTITRYQIRPGVDAATVEFGQLGYARVGRESYETFRRLREQGVIRPGVRFQVSLPTPVNILGILVTGAQIGLFEAAFERAIAREVDQLLESIPADDLCIQWDAPIEVRLWGGGGIWIEPWFSDVKSGLLDRLVRMGKLVPEPVELGYHLCYGDYEHTEHTRQEHSSSEALRARRRPPDSAAGAAELAEALCGAVPRAIDYVHIPVPRASGAAYFAPFADMTLPANVELYLGLVHNTDGRPGTRRRIELARSVVGDFGISTECGWGRRDPATVDELFAIHRDLSAPVAEPQR